MKANELRIGNWVKTNESEPFEVVGTFRDYVWCIIDAPTDFKINELEPIPLTEEWLERLGFGVGVTGAWFLEGRTYDFVMEDISFGRVPKGGGEFTWIANIEFVHELQNLFFSLTNKEL